MFEPTLLQYESPEVIVQNSSKKILEEQRVKAEKIISMSIDELAAKGSDGLDMLDVLIPPRIVKDSGKFWLQKVSRAPASARDLSHLQERLDKELIRLGASEIGLCETRRHLYDQLFDELTRQEIIVCPERGRLLRLIRREAHLSMMCLLSCYESGLAYGIKKKLSSFAEKKKLTSELTELMAKTAEMSDLIQDLEPKAAEVRKDSEIRELEIDKQYEAVEKKLEDENQKVLAELIACINVNIKEGEEEVV